jgi:carboxymethylenebutenolidase
MGFYGIPAGVLHDIAGMSAPLLVLAAGADQATSPQDNEAFDGALIEAGVEHEYVMYDGAPHSFFDRTFTDWTSACEDAWVRMLGFMDRHR